MSLNDRIAHFYDRSSPLWLTIWGEQMHHGYYPAEHRGHIDHQRAQLDMIDRLLDWSGWSPPPDQWTMLDAGCGVGGSSRYLCLRFPAARAVGVTLSPVQVERGNAYNHKAGLSERIDLQTGDVLAMQPDQHHAFDLIWSLECAEHIADKAALLQLFSDLLRPGGRLIMTTWCHRPQPPPLQAKEVQTLRQIQKLYHLPPLVSLPELEAAAGQAGLEHIRSDDWSEVVEPFWRAVFRSGLDPRNWPGLVSAGWDTLRGVWAMRYIRRGLQLNCLRYGLLTAQKPRD